MVSQICRLVGLEHVMNTRVGDAYIRGVSGGERRRVSLAESLATCARQVISHSLIVNGSSNMILD